MPEVSVIIPNYNHAEYLPLRIESVLNQTFDDFEVIILDDCSKDNSREVIERYRHHPKISSVVFNEENSGGTFKQWNKGFKLARGQYVWIAESDDYCEPTLLANLVPCFSQDESIVLSFCQTICATDAGKVVYLTEAEQMEQVLDGKQFVFGKMLRRNFIPNASMAVFRKSALEKIPTDYTEMRYCGDWLFWTRLCLIGKIYVCGKFLNYFRHHEKNVGTKAVRDGMEFIEGNEIFEIIKSFSPSAKQIEHAVEEKVERYLLYKRFYEPSVDEMVVNSLMKIKPDFKKRLFALQLKQSVGEFKRQFRRRLQL